MTKGQTVGLVALSDALLATFWVSTSAMMATPQRASPIIALSLHFLFLGIGNHWILVVWVFWLASMLSRGCSVGGESSGEVTVMSQQCHTANNTSYISSKGHSDGHGECHCECHCWQCERVRHCGDTQYFEIRNWIYVQTSIHFVGVFNIYSIGIIIKLCKNNSPN